MSHSTTKSKGARSLNDSAAMSLAMLGNDYQSVKLNYVPISERVQDKKKSLYAGLPTVIDEEQDIEEEDE